MKIEKQCDEANTAKREEEKTDRAGNTTVIGGRDVLHIKREPDDEVILTTSARKRKHRIMEDNEEVQFILREVEDTLHNAGFNKLPRTTSYLAGIGSSTTTGTTGTGSGSSGSLTKPFTAITTSTTTGRRNFENEKWRNFMNLPIHNPK